MRFSPSFLDEIRNRLPVSAVVGKRVALKKQGREWRGLSPFNKEKTPSFYVNDQKGFYHCFSSSKHGDQFTFLMEVEGLSFPEAVERLAGEAGLELPKPDPEAVKREERAKSLIEIVEIAAKFFEAQLHQQAGFEARAYLVQRELTIETQNEFRIGYAPPSKHALKEFLSGKGVAVEDMIAAGLLIGGDDIPIPYDRFRDRVIFPIQNARGQVIAFGGRALSKDVQAKYLNSPETPLFHKGAQLYNLNRARASAHTSGRLIVVEGYIDAITLSQAGYAHTVAPLGTAFTEDQLRLLWRLADTPVFCFDGDAAGLRAAERAIDVALPHLAAGKSLSFALLPAGLDPDDFVRQRGNEAFESVLAAAQPLVSLLWLRETRDRDLRTPEARAALEKRLHDIARVIPDTVVRKYYESEFRERLSRLFTPPQRSYSELKVRQGDRKAGTSRFMTPSAILGKARWPLIEATLLCFVIRYPEFIRDKTEEIAQINFEDPELAALHNSILAFTNEKGDEPQADIQAFLDERGQQEISQRLFEYVRKQNYRFFSQADDDKKSQDTFIKILSIHQRKKELNRELIQIKNNLTVDNSNENLARMRAIQNEISAVGAELAAVHSGEFDDAASSPRL